MKYLLTVLLLVLFALHSKAQSSALTNAEVYNLSVGDVLYIIETEGEGWEVDHNTMIWEKKIKRTVLNKTPYLPDSIVYSYLDSIVLENYNAYPQYYALNTFETITHLSDTVAYQLLLPSSNSLPPSLLADLCTPSELYLCDTTYGYYNQTGLRTTTFVPQYPINYPCGLHYDLNYIESLGSFFHFTMDMVSIILDSSRVLRGYERDGILYGNAFPVIYTGINDLLSTCSMQVYPNPANNQVQIGLPDTANHQNATLQITDLQGRVVKTITHITPSFGGGKGEAPFVGIATHDLPNGMYLVSYIVAGKQAITAKLLIFH